MQRMRRRELARSWNSEVSGTSFPVKCKHLFYFSASSFTPCEQPQGSGDAGAFLILFPVRLPRGGNQGLPWNDGFPWLPLSR